MADGMETAVETTMETVDTYTVSEDTDILSETTEIAEQTNEAVEVVEEKQQEVTTQINGERLQDLVFTPVYNGVVTPVRASDAERVTTLLQKGMKFERMAEDLEKLHQLKAAYGVKTTAELLDGMLEKREAAVKAAYVTLYGEAGADRVLELEKEQRNARNGTFHETDQAADNISLQTVRDRLADEFRVLRAEHPEVTSVHNVPQAVLRMSLQTGIALSDAFNRHILNEQRCVARAAQKRANNQQSAAGSLSDGGYDAGDPVTEAMMRGIWRRQ